MLWPRVNPIQKPVRTGQYGGGEEQEMLTYGPESYVPGDRYINVPWQQSKCWVLICWCWISIFWQISASPHPGTMSWARAEQVQAIATRQEPSPGNSFNHTSSSYCMQADSNVLCKLMKAAMPLTNHTCLVLLLFDVFTAHLQSKLSLLGPWPVSRPAGPS